MEKVRFGVPGRVVCGPSRYYKEVLAMAKRSGRIVLCVTCVVLVFTAAESKAAFVFDLESPNGVGTGGTGSAYDSIEFTVSGLTLTATGSLVTGESRLVTQGNAGLGIRGGGTGQINDTVNGSEVLSLNLTGLTPGFRAQLLSARFTAVDTVELGAYDDFLVTTDIGATTSGNIVEMDNAAPGRTVDFDAHGIDLQGVQFDFSVLGLDDDYRVRSVTFGIVPDPNPVPEPATVTLTGLGITAIGALRRRRARRAAAAVPKT